MSKIGRKPIPVDSNVQVEVVGQEIRYKGKNISGVHDLPDFIKAEFDGKQITLKNTSKKKDKYFNEVWGLNRALLYNKLKGISNIFEKKLQINGLGFKAEVSGPKVKFSLGYSHKIEKVFPKGVTIEVDKTGQLITIKSHDKGLLGQVCADIRSLRPPEPYKGTGIKLDSEVIRRKAGKTKAAAV